MPQWLVRKAQENEEAPTHAEFPISSVGHAGGLAETIDSLL
jgi:hypothetical protein